ncbi:DUF5808 domain-containing protein [Clostridium sp. C2-6-12]|uniref:DUF5808 domain-containing protein n=1 Tax=Clostridium sp. C2-6-12 TaxID=2698832 RepID=UPI00136A3F4B|nr:DUF5808 domain-containing protein [Clostridium sp. C2-6-12]
MNKRKWSNAEIKEYRKIHSRIIYYNDEDSNFFVPKAYGFGFTVNFANPIIWVFVITIILFIVISRFM